jgi:hypothetical protein
MTTDQLQSLKADFLAWSGGFEPESKYQITVYLDYARDSTLNREEVRNCLVGWMNQSVGPEGSLESR